MTPDASAAGNRSYGSQLVVNGKFVAGATGWKSNRADRSVEIVTDGRYDSRAAAVKPTTGGVGILSDATDTVAAAAPGTQYRAVAWVRAEVANTTGALRVREIAKGSVVVHKTNFTLADRQWQRVGVDLSVVGNAPSLDVSVIGWDMPARTRLRIDDVRLHEVLGTTTEPTTPTEPAARYLTNGCAYTKRGVPSCGAYFGAATGGNANPATLEEQMGGRLGVRRTYWQATQVGAAVDTARADLALGRLPWISFKLPYSWAAMAAGRGDAWAHDVAAQVASLDGPVWVAFHHEPENDSGAMTDWTAMQNRLGPILRQDAPNAAFTVILMGWHQFYGSQRLSMENMWPTTKVDVAGFDVYNLQGAPSGGKIRTAPMDMKELYYKRFQTWSERSGVPWALAETGYTNTAAAQFPHWIAENYRDLKSTGGIAFSYFNSPLNSDADWTLSTTIKEQDFRDGLRVSDRLR